MGLDQVPLNDVVPEERIDMVIVGLSGRAIEVEILPVPDPGHQADAQEVGQPKNGQVLALGIGVNGRRLDRRAVANQTIQDVNGFPNPTRNEMTEEQDVRIAHMMVGNASVAAIANMSLHQQVLFGQLILGPIGCHAFLIAPVARQREAVKAVGNIANGRFQLFCREMAAVDMGNLVGVEHSSEMTGHLVRT